MAILTSKQVSEKFFISMDTTLQLFKMKGSPSFKAGKDWRVEEEELKKFLQKQSEEFKS